MKKIVFIAIAFSIFACNDSKNSKTMEQNETSKKYGFTETPFGEVEGQPITKYTIINPSGMQVSIIN